MSHQAGCPCAWHLSLRHHSSQGLGGDLPSDRPRRQSWISAAEVEREVLPVGTATGPGPEMEGQVVMMVRTGHLVLAGVRQASPWGPGEREKHALPGP